MPRKKGAEEKRLPLSASEHETICTYESENTISAHSSTHTELNVWWMACRSDGENNLWWSIKSRAAKYMSVCVFCQVLSHIMPKTLTVHAILFSKDCRRYTVTHAEQNIEHLVKLPHRSTAWNLPKGLYTFTQGHDVLEQDYRAESLYYCHSRVTLSLRLILKPLGGSDSEPLGSHQSIEP